MERFKKAYLEITNACNKNCSFCHGTKRHLKFMTKQEFERAISQLAPFCKYLYFHVLGEPLVHPQIYEFIELASSKGFKVTITTNGTLLEDTLLEAKLYKLQISLHSFEDNDRRAHRKYLDGVLQFAQKSSDRGILTSLRLWNVGSVDNSYAESVIREYFPDEWQIGRDNSYTLKENLFLNYAVRFEWQDMNSESVNTSLFCYGLRDQIAVLSDGTVTPCCLDAEGEIPLGNIYSSDLAEIISSKRARAIYDGFSARKPIEELCKRCTYAQRFSID